MQQSGHIIAHIAQPKHSDVSFPAFGGIPPLFKFAWRENFTGFAPRRFKPLPTLINPLGQKLIHNKQPLHFSLSIVILAIVVLEFLYS